MNRSMPPSVIIPELPYPNVLQAADWLCRALGFEKRLQIADHRVQLSFGQGSIVVTQAKQPGASLSVMVCVSDVDDHFEHAKQAGARIIHLPANYP